MNDVIWIIISLIMLAACSFGLGYIIGFVKTREETERELFNMLNEYLKIKKFEDEEVDVFYDVHDGEENKQI